MIETIKKRTHHITFPACQQIGQIASTQSIHLSPFSNAAKIGPATGNNLYTDYNESNQIKLKLEYHSMRLIQLIKQLKIR
jgi:hypothetical protein